MRGERRLRSDRALKVRFAHEACTSVNRDPHTKLTEVHVHIRVLHRTAVPERRHAHVPADADIPAQTEHRAEANSDSPR